MTDNFKYKNIEAVEQFNADHAIAGFVASVLEAHNLMLQPPFAPDKHIKALREYADSFSPVGLPERTEAAQKALRWVVKHLPRLWN